MGRSASPSAAVAASPADGSGDSPILLLAHPAGAGGGIALFTRHLAEQLGTRTPVALMRFRRLYPSCTRPGRAERSRAGRPDLGGRLVPHLPWTWRRAARQLETIAPSVVVLQWWHPLLAPAYGVLLRAARRCRATVVLVCHNADPHERFPLAGRLTRNILSRVDHVAVLSDFVAAQVRALAPGACVQRLPLPPLLAASPSGRPRAAAGAGVPEVLFFGHVRAYKGVEDLLVATSLLLPRRLVRVRVVGSFYEPLARYRRLVSELGIGAHVALEDRYVPDGEVSQLLGRADVLVLPYRSASQSAVLPLARRLRVPVVATDVGAMAADLDGAGVLVAPRCPQELADGILAALADPALAVLAPAPDGWDAWRAVLTDLRHAAALRHRPAGPAAYIPTDRREEVA